MQVLVVELGEEVVYPIHGDLAIHSWLSPKHPTRERPIENSQMGQLELMWEESAQLLESGAPVIALARRIQGSNSRLLVDLGFIGNYISAQCQAGMDLEVQSEEGFKWLTLTNESEVHVQGGVWFIHCGGYKCKVLA